MQHAYAVRLHFRAHTFIIPWLFTSLKEACTYGEYKFRLEYDLDKYEIVRLDKPCPFYKLK